MQWTPQTILQFPYLTCVKAMVLDEGSNVSKGSKASGAVADDCTACSLDLISPGFKFPLGEGCWDQAHLLVGIEIFTQREDRA